MNNKALMALAALIMGALCGFAFRNSFKLDGFMIALVVVGIVVGCIIWAKLSRRPS